MYILCSCCLHIIFCSLACRITHVSCQCTTCLCTCCLLSAAGVQAGSGDNQRDAASTAALMMHVADRLCHLLGDAGADTVHKLSQALVQQPSTGSRYYSIGMLNSPFCLLTVLWLLLAKSCQLQCWGCWQTLVCLVCRSITPPAVSQQCLFCIIEQVCKLSQNSVQVLFCFCRANGQPPPNVDFDLSFSQDGAYMPILSKLKEATAAVPEIPGEICISAGEKPQNENPIC